MTGIEFGSDDWLLKREREWQQYCNEVSDELSTNDLKFIKPIFFEPEFDYGNRKKYGKFALDFGKAFVLCPLQNRQRWKTWFEELLPNWLGKEFSSELGNLLLRFGFFGMHRFWDVQTSIDFFRFCFGEKISFGQYGFLKYNLKRHPLLEGRCRDFHERWVSGVCAWLSPGSNPAGLYFSEITDMWVSINKAGLLHPAFYNYELHLETVTCQQQLQELFLACHKAHREGGKVNIESPEKLAFVNSFVRQMDSMDSHSNIGILWQKSKSSDFSPAHKQEPPVFAEDMFSLNHSQISEYITERVLEIEGNC